MKQAILDKVEEAFKKAEAYYGRTFSRPKHIIFKRKGTTAGHCWYAKSELMFQIALAEQEGDKFLNETPAHEVAHWIDKEVNGYSHTSSGRRDIHGKKWQFIMTRVMGLPSNRCHTFDVSQVKTRQQTKHEYTCSCRSHFISTTLHNKILRGRWRKCLRCNQRIVLKQFNAVVPQKPIDNIQAQILKLQEQIRQLSNAKV